MAMLNSQMVNDLLMIYPLNMVIFHSKLVVSPCLTPGLRLKPRLAQVELLNVSQRHAANFAWLELGRHCYVAVKTCEKTWQKHRRSLSLSLNLSRFIRIYLEFIRMHLDIQFYPDFPDFPRFILSKIHGSVPVLDHDNSSKRRHTEGHQMAKRTMSIASLPQHFE
jgi:hypothetical protein